MNRTVCTHGDFSSTGVAPRPRTCERPLPLVAACAAGWLAPYTTAPTHYFGAVAEPLQTAMATRRDSRFVCHVVPATSALQGIVVLDNNPAERVESKNFFGAVDEILCLRPTFVTMQTIEVSGLTAIDVHVHAHAANSGGDAADAAQRYFGASDVPVELDRVAEYYRSRRMACIVFSVDEKLSGRPVVSNDDVLRAAARNADVLIPFISVDPTRGDAIAELERLIATGDVQGFKLHPPLQAFFPNDRSFYAVYETLAATRKPVVFHTGHSGIGSGVRGGGGIRLKYGNPMYLDDVAVDFPDMPIIMAHPSFPWQDEALSVCLHKPNVYIDLSGWSPKYFPASLVQYANTLLRKKVLFGSDYPLITPDRWLADFAALPIRDEVRPLILKDNAAELLGLRPR